MTISTVYTKSLQLPVYVLYQCQSCKKPVAVIGSVNIFASYSDRGTWTKKGLSKREGKTTDFLVARAVDEKTRLKKSVQPVRKEYRRVSCSCPYCGHSSLCVHDKSEEDRIGTRAAWIAAAAVFAALLVYFLASGSLSAGAAVFFSALAGGVVALVAPAFVESYENILMKKVRKTATPMISANKALLLSEAESHPFYKDVDTAVISLLPDVLDPRISKQS